MTVSVEAELPTLEHDKYLVGHRPDTSPAGTPPDELPEPQLCRQSTL